MTKISETLLKLYYVEDSDYLEKGYIADFFWMSYSDISFNDFQSIFVVPNTPLVFDTKHQLTKYFEFRS